MATLDDARLIVLVRDKLGVPEPMLNQFRRVAAAGGRSLGELLIEMGLTSQHQLDTLVARGFEHETVARIERLLYIAEYKRRQAPPGVKLGSRNFGRDRRYPITNAFRTS